MTPMPKRLFLLVVSVMLLSCENTTYVSSIPSYPVHMVLNILGEYPNFVAEGNIAALSFPEPRFPNEAVGYGGVVVFTAFDNQYHACDLCCPHCMLRDKPVEFDGGFYMHCPSCGEDYDISYGYALPTKGISTERLRPYRAVYGNGRLTITQQ